jgi:hypothetical protein
MSEQDVAAKNVYSSGLNAIDVAGIPGGVLSWDRVVDGVAVENLPKCKIDEPTSHVHDAAVLSWRWDRQADTGRSRNIALALKHAQEAGINYLFIDVVSLDQSLPKASLLRSVVDLANLYSSIPVIAAYDEEPATMDDWSNTLQRPWILSEIRAYCQNPTNVTYVGYRHSPDCRRGLSFANEVSVIRSSGYAGCILEILCGRVKMTDVADFTNILAEFSDVVSACYSKFARADYLLAVFLLTAKYERHQTVSRSQGNVDYGFRTDVADPMFDRVGLEQFTVGPFLDEKVSFQSAQPLVVNGHNVAIWRSKMTSSYDRNWIEVLPDAEDHIFAAVGLSEEASTAYKQRSGLRTAFLRIDKNAPTPSITEHAADLTGQSWLREIPAPEGTTLGFNAELWR